MRRKSHFLLYCCVTLVLAVLGGVLGYYYTLNRTKAQDMNQAQPISAQAAPEQTISPTPTPRPTSSPTPAPTPKPTEKASGQYVILEKAGTVGVYQVKGDDWTLLRSVEINTDALRAEDRVVLQNGITADSKEEILEVLENFVN